MDIKGVEQRAKEEGIGRFVVGAAIVNNDSILFIRRARDDFMGGVYELPSGKADDGEGLIDALKREILEETSLVISDVVGLCDTFDYISKSGTRTRQFNFVVSVDNVDSLKLDPKEHDLFEWIKFEDIESSNMLDETMKSIARKALRITAETENQTNSN